VISLLANVVITLLDWVAQNVDAVANAIDDAMNVENGAAETKDSSDQ
jgi:hypothetical protein